MLKNILMTVLMIAFFSSCGGYYSEYYYEIVKASPVKINEHKTPEVVVQRELPSLEEINQAGFVLLGYSSFSSTFCGAASLECAINTGMEYGADLVIVRVPTFVSRTIETINVTRKATVNTNTSYDGSGRFTGDYGAGRFTYSGQSQSQSKITYSVPENITYDYYSFGAYYLMRKK